MLTNNTITNIDPGEWLSLPLSMVPEPVQEHVLQAKCPAADYHHVPVPCGVPNDHQGAEALWSYTKYLVASTKKFQFYLNSLFSSFTDNQLRPPTPRWRSSQNGRLIITCWLWRVKSSGKMKRSLKTIYYWNQRGSGGRCDINVRLLKPLGVHSCLIAECVIFLDCISLGIKRTTGANLMKGYFISIQSHSGNMLQLRCEPRVFQACTFTVGFKTIYFK